VRRGDGLSVANTLFFIVIPYAALTVFVIGFIYRIVFWARSPVPFHIPTVCGQQKSLPWIKGSITESPVSMWGVFGRMALEVLLFRSLFRNDRAELVDAKKAIYRTNLLLWLGGLIFHWSLLIILLRHVRLFFEPVPGFVTFLQNFDGLFHISSPTLFITDILIVILLCYLVFRRISNQQIRYISLFSDYFCLALILGTVISGILTRHLYRVDLLEVKRFTLGILSFCPIVPKGMGQSFMSIFFWYVPFWLTFPSASSCTWAGFS